MNGVNELRDMGGLKTPGGKIKTGMLFRSALPQNAAEIAACGIDSVIDLRADEEVKERPEIELKNAEYVFAPVFDGRKYKYIVVTTKGKLRCLSLAFGDEKKLIKNKTDSYAEMPFSPAYNEIFMRMDEGKKILFHCTEGKDRTGIAAVIIEAALGRSYDEILKEYLLTESIRPHKNRQNMRKLGIPQKLIDAVAFCESPHGELLEIAKNEIISRFGSLDVYLEEVFGITAQRREKWKKIYTEGQDDERTGAN